MTITIKKALTTLTLPILITTLTINGMELTLTKPNTQNTNIIKTGTLQFDSRYKSSGYCGETLRNASNLFFGKKIALSEECIAISCIINRRSISSEEMKFVQKESYMEFETFDNTIEFKMAIPAKILKGLQYNDTVKLPKAILTFKQDSQDLKKIRKGFKSTPEIITTLNFEIYELLNNDIIAIENDNDNFIHGPCGSGPKSKSIQNNSAK